MTDATVPAILGGDPIVDRAHPPTFPLSTELEIGLLTEITNSRQWFGFGDLPPYWRTILEQLVAETTGYKYGIGVPNGTLGIANGLHSQLLAKTRTQPGWDRGRDQVLVADLTHASAHHGVLVGLLPQLQRKLTLVPVDAKPDATMNDDIVESYLAQHAERVLAIVPATMYGAFGNISRLCELAESHNVIIHHDNALGGAARYDGRLAVTASISGQGQGKAVPRGRSRNVGNLRSRDRGHHARRYRYRTTAGAPRQHPVHRDEPTRFGQPSVRRTPRRPHGHPVAKGVPCASTGTRKPPPRPRAD
jgi:hypothetical protein